MKIVNINAPVAYICRTDLIYAGNEEGRIRFKKEVTEIKNCFEHCLGKIKKKDSFKMTDLEETMSYFLY